MVPESAPRQEETSKFGRFLKRLKPWHKVSLVVCGGLAAVGTLICAIGIPAGAALIVIGIVGGAVVLGYAYFTDCE